MTDPTGGYIDQAVALDDVGGGNRLAATLIGWEFTCLAIVDCDRLGDGTPMVDPHCREVEHEQTGPLSIEFARRIASAQRRITHRCGRRTKSGLACQIRVHQPGDACSWHSKPTERNNNA